MGGGAAAVLAWQAGRGWEMMTTGRALRGPAGVGRDLHPQGETTDSQEDIRSNGRGGWQSHRARAGRPPGNGPQTGCGLAAKLCALKGICLHRLGPLCSEQGERPVPAPPGHWRLGWDRRGRRPGRRAHLEELDADAGEHELQESGDQDDVADGADGHEHTLHHVLWTEGLVSTRPLAVPRCLPAPQRLREAPGEEWLPRLMLTPHLAKGWGGCPGSGPHGPSLPSRVLPSPLSPSALWPC